MGSVFVRVFARACVYEGELQRKTKLKKKNLTEKQYICMQTFETIGTSLSLKSSQM